MKELTIEQKAQRYDEAIERARLINNKGSWVRCGSTEPSICEQIFPELAESEDERIRKELINYFLPVDARDSKKQEWIAWLEKQGEQKPDWSEEDENNINSVVSRLEVDIEYWESRSKRRVDEDKRIINWLKSLRPKSQWKPSDAQLNVLTAISSKEILSGYERGMIAGLYTELKKLREE